MLGTDSNQSRVRVSDGTHQPGQELLGGAQCYNIAVVGCLFPAGFAGDQTKNPWHRKRQHLVQQPQFTVTGFDRT